jgi:adenylate kinase family enzyme
MYRYVFNVASAGGGKSTLSANLEDVFDLSRDGSLTILSMSKYLQTLCRQDGGLVDDAVVIETFREVFTGLIQPHSTSVPFIYVDGFPRTPQQAQALQGLLTGNQHEQCLIVHWQVSPLVAVERQMARWRSQKHDSALRRPDYLNDEKAAQAQAFHRLKIHHEHEEEILDVLRAADFVISRLDANGEPDEVCQDFLRLTGWPVDEESFLVKFKHPFDEDEDDEAVA